MPRALTPDRIDPSVRLRIDGREVRVLLTYDVSADGASWSEHQIEGHPDGTWLTIDTDDRYQLVASIWQERRDLIRSDVKPGKRHLEVDRRDYRRVEHEKGTYQARGKSESGAYEYIDYEADADWLTFERYDGGPWEAVTGAAIPIESVVVEEVE